MKKAKARYVKKPSSLLPLVLNRANEMTKTKPTEARDTAIQETVRQFRTQRKPVRAKSESMKNVQLLAMDPRL
jgi:hypothetical protein